MADYVVGSGSSGGDFQDTLRRAQAASVAQDELNRKEAQRRSAEEQTAGVEQRSAATRGDLAGTTAELSAALTENTSILGLETAAVRANTTALEQNLATRRALIASPLGRGETVAYGGGRGGGGGTRPVAYGGFEEDPNAHARVSAAQRALAEAELARVQAQTQVQTARKGGAGAEELAPLVGTREAANLQVNAARREVRAAEQSAQAQEAIAVQKREQLSQEQRINAELQARSTAEAQSALEARAVAESIAYQQQARTADITGAVAGARGVAFGRPALSTGAAAYMTQEEISRSLSQVPVNPGAADVLRNRALGYGYNPAPLTGGRTSSLTAVPTEEMAHYRQVANDNEKALAGLEGRQRAANQTFQEAGAIYADTSTRLSRHGALTTEFIQALAQGQVSLREFESQMVSTIGKFGGWAIAGAAVYGVYDALKNLLEGATETQAAIQNLGRFIPGLGGPAGGGRGQVTAASQLLGSISTQFNVPISDVSGAMQVVARRFPNLRDAGDATRAVLAAQRLDQVPAEQGENFMVGIANSLGFNRGSQLVGVVNSLNALQVSLGARVNQTLPAIARAAPAALASGVAPDQLEALAALGVRSGIPGNQVGTALLRSFGTFAFRPQSQIQLAQFGIRPQVGQAGQLYSDVFAEIDKRSKEGRPFQGTDLRQIAQALGGPLLGTRTLLPLLVQEAARPGLYSAALETARHPRPYQEDLNALLGSVGERFRAIGIDLQNFGNHLAAVGALAPITGLLDGINLLAHVMEALATPVVEVLGVFNQLPSVVRDALGVFIAFRAARYLGTTQFGGAAQSFIGRLPGFEDFRNQPREAVTGTVSRLERELLPVQRSDTETAALRYYRRTGDVTSAQAAIGQIRAQGGGLSEGDAGFREYQAQLGEAVAQEAAAAKLAATAGEEYGEEALKLARMEAELLIFKDENLSWERRATAATQLGYATQVETNNLRDQILAELRGQLVAGGGIGPRVAGGAGASIAGAEAGIAGGVAAATAAAADALARDPTSVGKISDAIGGSASSGDRFFTAPLGGAPQEGQRTAAEAQAAQERAARQSQTASERLSQAAQVWGQQFGVTGGPRSLAARGGNAANALGYGAQAVFEDPLGTLRSGAGRFSALASSPGAPFAGLLASQLVGSAVGGGAGDYISTVGGGAASGALIGQLLGGRTLAGLTAGTVLGNFQHSNASGIGSLVGGGIGAAIGTLTDFVTGPAGTLGGAAIGSAIGGFVGSLFGGGSGGASTDPQNAANKRVQKLLSQGGVGSLSDNFGQTLEQAFTATGSASTNAQATVKSRMDALTAELQLFGPASPQGGAARQTLDQIASAAVAEAPTNPAAAAQVLQQAQQVRQQSIQDRFKSQLSQASTPRQAQQAAAVAGQAYQTVVTDEFGGALTTAQQAYQGAMEQLHLAIASGSQKQIANARKVLSGAAQELQGAQAAQTLAQQSAQASIQAAAQTALAQEEAGNAADAGLAAARAGGNVLNQLAAQRTAARRNLSAVNNTPGLDPATQRTKREGYQQQLIDNANKTTQQQFAELQSQGRELVSTAAPGDTVGAAQLGVSALRTQLSFMRAHRHTFDPSQIRDMVSQLNDAQRTLTQDVVDRATQMVQLAGQLAQARDYGNSVAQAQDAIHAAQGELAVAVTPQQRLQAQVGIITGQNQLHQAGQERIRAQGQLQAALAGGNDVAVAEALRKSAAAELGNAHGVDEQIAAMTQLAQADSQLRQARIGQITALGQLAASTTSDPLQQLRDQIAAVAKTIAIAHPGTERVTQQTSLNNLKLQYQSTLIDTRESTIQFQLDMQEISAQQAIHQLQQLLHLKDISKAQRQTILESIRKIQAGDFSPIGGSSGGGFDLAPGNVRLPTYYDVTRGLRSAPPGGLAHVANNVHAPVQINVYVRRAEDVPKVADALDRGTGGHLHHRLHAAGVTG